MKKLILALSAAIVLLILQDLLVQIFIDDYVNISLFMKSKVRPLAVVLSYWLYPVFVVLFAIKGVKVIAAKPSINRRFALRLFLWSLVFIAPTYAIALRMTCVGCGDYSDNSTQFYETCSKSPNSVGCQSCKDSGYIDPKESTGNLNYNCYYCEKAFSEHLRKSLIKNSAVYPYSNDEIFKATSPIDFGAICLDE